MDPRPHILERERLSLLRALKILDSEPEPEYDDLVQLATVVTGAPIALVSLVDADRQWFKARCGLEFRETPRSVSFCALALSEETPLIIEDASQDPRFADNPLVTGELRIRFYAGAPILVNGLPMGTVCVLDTSPRTIDASQISALQAIARQAAALLEARIVNTRLAASEARFHAFMDNVPGASFLKDGDGRYRYVNKKFEEFFDASAEQIEGVLDSEWLPQEIARENRVQERYVLSMRRPLHYNANFPRADGSEREWSVVKFPVEMEEDRWIGVIAFDVTDQRASDRRIAESERRFRMAAEAMHEGILLVGKDLVIVASNPQAHAIFGVAPNSLVGLNMNEAPWQALSRDGRLLTSDERPIHRTLKGEVVLGFEVQIRQPSGNVVWVRMNCEPMYEEGADAPYAVIATCLDVSEEINARLNLAESFQQIQDMNRELESRAFEIAEARDAALASARAKSQFLANMSHEVRTPLNGVLGTTTLLDTYDLDPEVRRLVGIIRSSGETLLRVIDDILDFSKIDAGKLDIENASVELSEIVRDVAALYQAQAERRGLYLRIAVPAEMPRVFADPVRIKQVLANLVSNAVKFTSVGGVVVELCADAAEGGHLQVVLSVSDTGIGIPSDRQEAIFDTFIQADTTTHRRFGGTGLGLAICRRLVALMGGEISVESQRSVGSRFIVKLDLEVDASKPALVENRPLPPLPCKLRILLAEDNDVNALVASALLRRLGCEVVVVADGVSAIAQASSDQFDAILMDVHMPECDGLEATRTIRQLPEGAEVPIVALTASALADDREACLQAGMNGFLSKPFTLDALRLALDNVCARRLSGTVR